MRSVSAINCFNLEHSCLVRSRRDRVSRPRTLSDSAAAARPGGVASRRTFDRAPSVFTTPGWLWWIDAWCLLLTRTWRRFLPPRSSSIEPVTRLSRRSDAPAYESLRIGPHTLTTPRPLRSETREDLTTARSGAPSVEKCISSTGILRHPPRATVNLVPHHASSLDSGGFAAIGSCATPLHRDDAVLLCANTVVSARPPFTSANRFDADASLGQTQPFDFCNEFSITTHEHITASAALARRRGLPYDRCHARCAFHAALPILFCNAKMVRARCAAASYA